MPARQTMKLGSPPSSHTRRMMLSHVIAAVVTLTFAASALAAFVQQGEKLTGQGEVGTADAGYSVALSADGNTAVVGGPCDGRKTFSAEEPCIGAAWVFTRTGSTWTQQTKLTGAGEIGSGQFGAAVALSADGNTALIGGEKDRRGVGAAWIFSRTGTTWTQQAKLTQGATHSPRKVAFGSSVALSEDGNTALIGGYFDRHGRGAAWVFNRTGALWTRQGSKLTASDEKGKGAFGASVALSADGNTALIGGPTDHRAGSVWAFTRARSVWTQQGSRLTGVCNAARGSFGFEGDFGASVALSADGSTALIGEPSCGVSNCGGSPHCLAVGRVYVFTRSGPAWNQPGQRIRKNGGEENGGFAASVALSADGNTALIATPGRCGDFGFCSPGEAWQFVRSREAWTQQGGTITGSGEVERPPFDSVGFGTSVALSADVKTALIGGPGDNEFVGAAWVFAQ